MHRITSSFGIEARLAALVLTTALLPARVAGEAEAVDFNAHIRPLLADRCFRCHGPDEPSRKARLRLDLREGALAQGRAGRPILQPGDPAGSELVRRILTGDPDDLMPPPDSNLSLTDPEKELIRHWVAQGG